MIYLSVAAFYILQSWAKIPDWINNGTSQSGNILVTVCSGVGPSIDSARSESIAGCKRSAIDNLSTKANFQSVSIETDKEVAIHNSVESHIEFKNLVCKTVNEEIQETESQFKVWTKCKFDLKAIEKKEITSLPTNQSLIEAEKISNHNISAKEIIKSEESKKSVTISTIPSCEEFLIKSAIPRIIKCDRNPTSLILSNADSEIIIRRMGYKPKTLKVKEVIGGEHDDITVHLDK